MNPHDPSPPVRPPIGVFLGIVGLSVLFFFLFTVPNWNPFERPNVEAGPKKTAKSPAAADGDGDAADAGTKRKNGASSPPAPVVFVHASDVMQEFCTRLRSGDLDSAFRLVRPDAATGPRPEFLRHLLTNAGYRLAADDPAFAEAGRETPVRRFALKLDPPAGADPPPEGSATVDTVRDPDTRSWQIAGFRFGDALIARAADLLRAKTIVVDPADLHTPPDALAHARAFFDAVTGRDFAAARQLTDRTTVTQEKLAGLCIVFEEGRFRLAGTDPLTITAAGDRSAWAIAGVHSEIRDVSSELGLEMKRAAADDPWTIAAIDFSAMLETWAKATDAGKVYYSPIVDSPQGGESLVLYFEFDESAPGPRARRQLEIVAALLDADPAKKLRISGHADNIGPESYNYRLSAARATSVRDYLHELGVNPAQVETIGFGDTAPLDANRLADGSDNPEGRSRNRRTEIYLDF